tara:strand:+ start:567 stop:929 length:363 start_codon:yes stop_codon:yes gene_type:complete
MGYRSKVIFGVKEKHKDKFNKLIDKACKLDGSDYMKKKISIVSPVYEEDNWIVFKDDYLKWYSDYPAISLINDTIFEWCEDEDMGAFRICLGEDGYKDECGHWYDVVAEEHNIKIIEKSK